MVYRQAAQASSQYASAPEALTAPPSIAACQPAKRIQPTKVPSSTPSTASTARDMARAQTQRPMAATITKATVSGAESISQSYQIPPPPGSAT